MPLVKTYSFLIKTTLTSIYVYGIPSHYSQTSPLPKKWLVLTGAVFTVLITNL